MRVLGLGLLLLLVALLAAGLANYLRPVPALTATTLVDPTAKLGSAPQLPWPSEPAEGALGAVGMGVLAQTSAQQPQPTASIAKVMTALVVLGRQPLGDAEQGPAITVTSADVAEYQADAAQGQSTVEVTVGEQLSEYQALQAVLIPSGNNVATLLLRWAFGSLTAGVAAMNAEASKLGMTGTHFADASGFSPATVSTPVDLVRLGEAAMGNAVIAGIVRQPSATLPVAGEVDNVDSVLGQSGIVGIKTGNSDQQPGAFLFAAPVRAVPDAPVVGVVLGVPNLEQALRSAPAIVSAAAAGFQPRTIIAAGQEAAQLVAPWGVTLPLVAARAITVTSWGGETVRKSVSVRRVTAPVRGGSQLGWVTVRTGAASHRAPLVAATAVGDAPWTWRVARRPPFVPQADWPRL